MWLRRAPQVLRTGRGRALSGDAVLRYPAATSIHSAAVVNNGTGRADQHHQAGHEQAARHGHRARGDTGPGSICTPCSAARGLRA